MEHTWKTAITEALKSLKKPAETSEMLREIQRLGLIDTDIKEPLATIRSILYRASTRKDEYANPSSEILFEQRGDGRWVLFSGRDDGDRGTDQEGQNMSRIEAKAQNAAYDGQMMAVSDGGTGVEEEVTESGELITEPFDASSIRVSTKFLTIGQLMERVAEGALDISPDFQRKFVWKEGAQSRLIESLFIRFPLPAFYMDATNDDRWLVVDGLQRLTTIKKFMRDELRLTELEFLEQYNGKLYSELPLSLKRRIKETQTTLYLIEEGTPPDVKFNIFKRINTGGLPLSAQEIRHAINSRGPVTKFLARLATSRAFKQATDYGVRGMRMEDREMVLRFLTFAHTPYTEYERPNFDNYLNHKMEQFNKILKSESKQEKWESRFKRAMDAAYRIFGNDAFRKRYREDARRSFINKALFEAWSVNFDKLTDEELERLIKKRSELKKKFIKLMNQKAFNDAVSQGTGSIKSVNLRFSEIEKIIREVLA